MLRYQVFLAYCVAFLAVWYYGLQKREELELPPTLDLLVVFAPVWGVLTLGVYLLTRLIIGVFTYQDCPEAAEEIEKQIAEARAEMKKRRITT